MSPTKFRFNPMYADNFVTDRQMMDGGTDRRPGGGPRGEGRGSICLPSLKGGDSMMYPKQHHNNTDLDISIKIYTYIFIPLWISSNGKSRLIRECPVLDSYSSLFQPPPPHIHTHTKKTRQFDNVGFLKTSCGVFELWSNRSSFSINLVLLI